MADGGQGLTAWQRELARMVCREWLGHGLTLRPADRATAEAGVRLVYRAAGLPPPRRVIWAGSPLAGVVAALALTAGSDAGLRVGAQVWEQVWARLAAEAGMPAGDPFWAHLEREQVGAPVWSRLREPVWEAWGSAWARAGSGKRCDLAGTRAGSTTPVRWRWSTSSTGQWACALRSHSPGSC